tara:strand:+ start:2748 stop:3791 length:1044 start_codon:yes stop_codon:yes gene_type:complete
LKNLSSKLIAYLQDHNNINPNNCQINASKEIDFFFNDNLNISLVNFFKKKIPGIYIYGSVGVGKSILLKALHMIFPKSEIFHFSDLIFHLQNCNSSKKNPTEFLKNKKLIIIDEFYLNNLTNLVLFKNFFTKILQEKKIVVMSGNKELGKIYFDPVNSKLCGDIKNLLLSKFMKIKMKSKIDYRSSDSFNLNFFFVNQKNSRKFQDLLRKKLSSTSKPQKRKFRRDGNSFTLKNIYGNLLDLKFSDFFEKNLIFQDYELIAKKFKIIIIRNVPKMTEDYKNLVARFIFFIDVIYENKNILSISTDVELEKIYLGRTNSFEFKRTVSRLKEMGSNAYVKDNLNFLQKN